MDRFREEKLIQVKRYVEKHKGWIDSENPIYDDINKLTEDKFEPEFNGLSKHEKEHILALIIHGSGFLGDMFVKMKELYNG